MKKLFLHTILFSFSLIFAVSCDSVDVKSEIGNTKEQNEAQFLERMTTHLDAVSNRDLGTLESTMSPKGEMQLILPSTEIIDGVDGFMDYHKAWFTDTMWTFETKILNSKIGDQMGMAVTEVVYREPDRDGKPYFNRMIVSYDLENIAGTWYIVKDHATSVEKSTDVKD